MNNTPLPPDNLEKPDHDYLNGRVLRIGTRGSQMALAQTNLVVEELKKKLPHLKTEIVVILTSGDWKPSHGETRLMESKGGKGLFAHEIEERILAGEVDCGVHSLKDMPSKLPEGLEIKHFIARGDARDAFVSKKYARLEDMPPRCGFGDLQPAAQSLFTGEISASEGGGLTRQHPHPNRKNGSGSG